MDSQRNAFVASELTVHHLKHRFVERNVNRLCSLSEALRLPITNIDPQTILENAVRSTGLSDFGSDAFREPMERTIEAAHAPQYTALGHAFLRALFVRAASHRLQLFDLVKNQPEIFQKEVKRPIFVLGFPRTGTTVLQNLLEQEPGRRALRFYELSNPIPLHDDPKVDKARRLRNAKRDLWITYQCVPELRAVHETMPDTTEECWYLFSNTYAVYNMCISQGLKDFGEWLLTQDLTWAYQEYKLQLQLLMHANPAESLVLKCPEHLWFLEPLLKVFPDAVIVWTHRDPLESVASYSSMVSLARRTMEGVFDPPDVGAHIAHTFHQGVTRAMEVRDRVGEDRFFDVNFSDLVKNRRGTVEQICERFDLPLTDAGRANMKTWLDTPRHDGKGKHKYHHGFFDLDPKAIRAKYRDYIERFNIPITKFVEE